MENYDIEKVESLGKTNLNCSVSDGIVRIGNTHTSVYKPQSTTKIPQTLFFDIQQVKK